MSWSTGAWQYTHGRVSVYAYSWSPSQISQNGVQSKAPVDHDIWFEELGMCVDCSNIYFTHDDEEE